MVDTENSVIEEHNNEVIEDNNGQDNVISQETESDDSAETPLEAVSSDSVDPGAVTTGEKNASQEDSEYVKHVQNWRALREKAEKAEKERDELLARFNQSQQNSDQQSRKEEQFNLNDDDLTEGKHLKYYQQQNEKRIAELEGRLIENQIKANYPDFDNVVNKDTLGMLRDTDPELAESLASNPNIYSKAVAAYKSIKRYGLAESTYERDKEKVNKNVTKPRTVTSLSPQQGDSPLSRANAFANDFTEDDKLQTWKEMQDIINNA